MKSIRYWFTALPFTIAFKIALTYTIIRIFRIHLNFSFSQTGEDVILSTLMSKEIGFYVDVGCNEPIEKSNTFMFYLKGWKGISIDANEEVIRRHRKIRKYDTSICVAVSNNVKEVIFYKSETNAVCTISKEFYEETKKHWTYNEKQTLTTKTLTTLLDENLPKNTQIDLLTVDVEGIDLEVLQGMDFSKYRPKLIIVEANGFSIGDKEKHPIYQLLKYNDYHLHWFATMNAYFIDNMQF